jgi:hypothetical protein
MELTRAHFKVLDFASDESPLWELPWPLTDYPDSGETIETHAAMPRKDLVLVLEELVCGGFVEIYDFNSKRQPVLSPEAALQAVRDEANWLVPSESGRKEHYALVLTETGNEAFRQAYEQRTPGS